MMKKAGQSAFRAPAPSPTPVQKESFGSAKKRTQREITKAAAVFDEEEEGPKTKKPRSISKRVLSFVLFLLLSFFFCFFLLNLSLLPTFSPSFSPLISFSGSERPFRR